MVTKIYGSNASNISSGILAIAFGGTGSTTAAGAATALGLGTTSDVTFNTVTATTFVGAFSGTITNATTSNNLDGGVAGALPYQSAVNTTLFSAAGVSGQLVLSGGTGAPTFLNQNAITLQSSQITSALGYTPVSSALLGAASGVATLTAGGTLTLAQLPTSITSAMSYQGTWNAGTNIPALANGVGTKGYVYKVSTAGTTTLDGNSSWNVGGGIRRYLME